MEMDKKPPLAGFMHYFSLVMILVYLATGFAVLMAPAVFAEVPKIHKLPLGLLLIGYGVFRLYKWILQRAKTNE